MAALSTPNSVPPAWVGWWFRGAALYGAAALLLAERSPPGGNALFFHGFVGTALAFQLAFWIVGGDPARHRPLMPVAVLEKAAFVVPVTLLAMAGRAAGGALVAGAIDLMLGIGFLVAWRVTPGR